MHLISCNYLIGFMYGDLTYRKQSFIQWMKIMTSLHICIRMTISKLRPPWRVHSNCKIATGRQRNISNGGISHAPLSNWQERSSARYFLLIILCHFLRYLSRYSSRDNDIRTIHQMTVDCVSMSPPKKRTPCVIEIIR